MLEARRSNHDTLIKKVVEYVINRQNEDGGYTFCQGTESSAQDTYYGLAILSSLKTSFPNVQQTIRFLNALDLDTVYSDYYISRALLLCGEKIGNKLRERIVSRLNSKRFFGSVAVFSEVPSEFMTTLMTLELADLLKMSAQTQEAANWLMQFRNVDGGFGTKGESNINSTYYAVASLNLLERNLKDLREAVTFVRACERPYGGFTVIPMNSMPYMEHTYYGVMTLELFGEKNRYPSQTIDFVLKCQNKNGGFARSDIGISSFADTYSAIAILQKINMF